MRRALIITAMLAGCGAQTAKSDAMAADADGLDATQTDGGLDAAADALMPDAPTACPTLDPASYGPCGTALGAVFDGTNCTLVSGCDCGSDCAHFFATQEMCASTCAEAGRCNPGRFTAYNGMALAIGTAC